MVPRDMNGVAGLDSSADKQLFGLNTAFLVFAAIVISVRLIATRYRSDWYGPEDYLCLASFAAFIAQTGVAYVMILDAHIGNQNPTPGDIAINERMVMGVQFPYAFSMGFVRASIVVFEMRLFNINRTFKRVTWIILALIIAWTLMVFITALTICHPIKYNWDTSIPGECGNRNTFYAAIAGSGIVLDAAIFIAPIPIVWNLKTTVTRRLWVTLLFAVGLFDIVIGALRLVSAIEGIQKNPVPLLRWSIMEPSIAIFVASAPHYRGIYNHISSHMDEKGLSLPSLLRSLRNRSASDDNSSGQRSFTLVQRLPSHLSASSRSSQGKKVGPSELEVVPTQV